MGILCNRKFRENQMIILKVSDGHGVQYEQHSSKLLSYLIRIMQM